MNKVYHYHLLFCSFLMLYISSVVALVIIRLHLIPYILHVRSQRTLLEFRRVNLHNILSIHFSNSFSVYIFIYCSLSYILIFSILHLISIHLYTLYLHRLAGYGKLFSILILQKKVILYQQFYIVLKYHHQIIVTEVC